MRSIPKAQYEAMFLFGQSAAADLKGAVEHVKEILGRNNAEIVALKKWGDRPLAYPIRKQKRGIYVLAYFIVPTDKLATIERSCNLSEQILRTLITRIDHLGVEEMKNMDGQLDLTIEANLRAGAQPAPIPAPASSAPVSHSAPAGVGVEDEME